MMKMIRKKRALAPAANIQTTTMAVLSAQIDNFHESDGKNETNSMAVLSV